jgi:hypothetical protein
VRELLRLLAARCDELEARLALVEAVPEIRVSRILKNVHASAQRLHDAGHMSASTTREFGQGRLSTA